VIQNTISGGEFSQKSGNIILSSRSRDLLV
jgi:hypothetical protein